MAANNNSALSPRELQCLDLLARGLSNGGIAENIGIKTPTVAMHLANARAKLKAESREHAIAIAITKGLVRL